MAGEHGIKGLSIMAGRNFKYFGKYSRGRWQDDCEHNDVPEEERKGWGFKFDIMFGYTIRPIPKFWKLGFITNKPKIGDIPFDEWEEYFGEKLAKKMKKLYDDMNGYTKKYAAYNPWYGHFWFVLRLPKWIPTPYFSINTPWKSFYIGNKAYRIDPFERDMSWTNEKDEERAKRAQPESLYYALCPSMSLRSGRS